MVVLNKKTQKVNLSCNMLAFSFDPSLTNAKTLNAFSRVHLCTQIYITDLPHIQSTLCLGELGVRYGLRM